MKKLILLGFAVLLAPMTVFASQTINNIYTKSCEPIAHSWQLDRNGIKTFTNNGSASVTVSIDVASDYQGSPTNGIFVRGCSGNAADQHVAANNSIDCTLQPGGVLEWKHDRGQFRGSYATYPYAVGKYVVCQN